MMKKPCPTCNHEKFTPIKGSNGDLPPRKFQNLGEGNLCIIYDPAAPMNRYKLCSWGELRSDFFIYFCPTCGRRLPS